MRKIYLDNIRWATVLLVLIYHVFYVFNGAGVLGGIPGAKNIPAFDLLAAVIYPWFMVLLFVIAGMSARYALQKRTGGQFIKERAVKLLVPSTLGLFVVHWITGFLNIKMGGGLAYIPPALVYPISVVSGIGPLWFIQMLFLFSCVLVLLRKIDRLDLAWTACGRVNWASIIGPFVFIFTMAQTLNMPVLTMYRFGIYFAAFLTGYYVFSHEEMQERLEKMRVPALGASAVFGCIYAVRYGGGNYTSPDCLQSLLTNLYLWAVVLMVLGFGRKYFNRETGFTRYMTKVSFGLYILHYPVLITACYVLEYYFDFPALCNYAAALAIELVMTPVVYEAVRRVPVVRFLVLGVKKH